MRTSTIGLLLGALLAAACTTASGTTPTAVHPLEGPEWRLAALSGVDAEALGAIKGGVYVRFAQGRVEGFSGCNRLAGAYTIDGDRLVLGALAGTMMACPPPAMGVETSFTKAFTGTLAYAVDGSVLRLTPPAANEPALVFHAAPPPTLEGVAWQVTGFNNGRQAVVSPALGTTLSLTFADGAVSGSAGCNTFRAGYTASGDRIAIGAPAVTRKQCADDVMQQEREYLAAVQSARRWAVAGGLLDMHRADGERALTATP